MPKPWMKFEYRIAAMGILIGLPGSVVALVLIGAGEYSPKIVWTLGVFIVGFWLGTAFLLQRKILFSLRTLSNLLAALVEGDFSMRGAVTREKDAYDEVLMEINALSDTLREQRLGAHEAAALVRRVISVIDSAVFAFDAGDRLKLVNPAGERLLNQAARRLLGRPASELHLEGCLHSDPVQTKSLIFPGGIGRFGIQRSTFREGGIPHTLVVLTDLSMTLREEERLAWQRLVRVLGHELNNSLAPIKSIAGSLKSLLDISPRPPDWMEDMEGGLGVIVSRAEALTRFMEAYSRLARLPKPRFRKLQVGESVRRVLQLDTRLPVKCSTGPDVEIQADSDQLDQLLINLIRNAIDAALETGGSVEIGWKSSESMVEIWIRDEGPGLANTENLFVPFFTTKPGGSGIGLVLSRQIAEAHGGNLTLQNRPDTQGSIARLHLPVSQ